jgi:periplasmic divalent cation tolerance protein
MTEFVLAITTCPENEAVTIASSLVENKKCACANIIKGISSIYHWKGKIESDTECIILMKTEKDLTESLYESLRNVHSYEVPEFIVISIDNGSKEYLAWLSESVR